MSGWEKLVFDLPSPQYWELYWISWKNATVLIVIYTEGYASAWKYKAKN